MVKKKFLGYCPQCGEKIYYQKQGTTVTIEGHTDCGVSQFTPCEEKVLRKEFKVFYESIFKQVRDQIPVGVRAQQRYNDIKFMVLSGGAVCAAVLFVNILSIVFGA